MTPEALLLLRLFLLLIAFCIAGIAIEHYWPRIHKHLASKVTRRRMARDMGWQRGWDRVWSRRGMW